MQWEGGYVDYPTDRGGPTNWGDHCGLLRRAHRDDDRRAQREGQSNATDHARLARHGLGHGHGLLARHHQVQQREERDHRLDPAHPLNSCLLDLCNEVSPPVASVAGGFFTCRRL
ncbi:glycosyl hydrolase 108 family protein [Hydrogenophaga sp. XSHU_21]